MIKDYSGSFISVKSRNRIRTTKRKSNAASKELFHISTLMWKTIGAMLLLTLVFGISSTIWFGVQVQAALDQIGSHSKINTQMKYKKELLVTQRDLMLTRGHVEAAVQKLGLRSPAKNQIRFH
ncbi:MAG: hypothetical protein AMJ60_07840 [Desulfobacterales bacterium SG8_35]|nr:MAG: hypothetical protein AMJ60_07840 [Desulfobacterales bacterium SG8_35]